MYWVIQKVRAARKKQKNIRSWGTKLFVNFRSEFLQQLQPTRQSDCIRVYSPVEKFPLRLLSRMQSDCLLGCSRLSNFAAKIYKQFCPPTSYMKIYLIDKKTYTGCPSRSPTLFFEQIRIILFKFVIHIFSWQPGFFK